MGSEDHVSIEGTLLMLDDTTPHVAVVVQAISDGEVIATTLSDERGRYQLIDLEPGHYQLRCQVLGGYVYRGANETTQDESEAAYLQVEQGRTLKDVDLHFPAFKKGTWRNHTMHDGLPDDNIITIYHNPDGSMWVGTYSGGVFWYDGREAVNFTTEDGLASNIVGSICRGPDGDMWFGTGDKATLGSGVSRYDGKEFHNYTTQDGLAGNTINAIYCDPDGILWFGSGCYQAETGGVSQYDGKEFRSFTEEDGLEYDVVTAIHRDPDGTMWFGTLSSRIYQYDGASFRVLPGMHWVFTIHSEPDGTLWFGTWRDGVYRYDGKELVNFTTADGLASNCVGSIHRDRDGSIWFGTGTLDETRKNGVSRYDGRYMGDSPHFVNFTTHDGLAHNIVRAIHRDPDGVMWFGTAGGLSRYDEKTFTNLTTEDGLVNNSVKVIHRDNDGVLWFGTDSGVSRYDDGEFTSFTTRDGLAGNVVRSIDSTPDSVIWFGSRWGGISRYDGKEFRNLSMGQSFTDRQIFSVHRAPDGVMWFGKLFGVISYDGNEFAVLTGEDGLIGEMVSDIHSDPDGILWFGTLHKGVYRYDGDQFTNINMHSNEVNRIYSDPYGVVWIGTSAGVSRYDGETLRTFTKRDGLAHNEVFSIHRDPDGMLWFGTGGGVSAYDGFAWTSLDTEDGLAGDTVSSIYQDEDGTFWFGTDGGVTQYRPDTTPPMVRIVSVKTRGQSYTDLSEIPPITVGNDVTIEFNSIDFRTILKKRQYRYRIKELDSDWRRPTRESEFIWTPDKPGIYTFEVQAIDRDLNYSEPASVDLEVIPDPRDRRIIQLEAHIREQELAELKRAHKELEDARQIQQSLLPDKPPEVDGFEIAGISSPAKEVSGDFFTYLSLGENTGIVLADVTGKSVKAAMVATLADGMLNEAVKSRSELWNSPGMVLSELNIGLHPRLMRGMFTAMSLSIIRTKQRQLVFSNAGMPYPIVKRGKEIWELKVNGMPLGLIEKAEYEDLSVDLESGDFVVFCSDGVIEAENKAGEMYQSERLLRLIQQADPGLFAQEMVDLVVRDVSAFVGAEEASDDITIVVIQCKE